MKISFIRDLDAFFNVIGQCKGTVEVVSPEGDRLVLNSKLCQFVLTAMMKKEGGTLLDDLELKTSDPEDAIMITEFLMRE